LTVTTYSTFFEVVFRTHWYGLALPYCKVRLAVKRTNRKKRCAKQGRCM
jgi:hypothetical protein